MNDEGEQISDFMNWKASDWNDLQSIWRSLLPQLAENGLKGEPSFRNETISAQDAGIVFERLVLEAFRLSKAEVHEPFRVPSRSTSYAMEQIDGLVVVNEWQAFLVESKLHKESLSFNPIALLNHRVEQRIIGTVGLFFSASGYTDPARESAQYLRPIRVLLFDGTELNRAIETRDLVQLVKEKWIGAVKYGDPYYSVIESET